MGSTPGPYQVLEEDWAGIKRPTLRDACGWVGVADVGDWCVYLKCDWCVCI